MKKIFLDLPQYLARAVAENLADYSFVADDGEADFVVSVADFIGADAAKKIRIGAVIDKVLRDFGSSFEWQSIRFNLKTQTARQANKMVKLTEKEAALIGYLHGVAGYAPRQEILQHVWNYAENADTRTLESHVHRLNQKFEDEFGRKLVEHKDNAYRLS